MDKDGSKKGNASSSPRIYRVTKTCQPPQKNLNTGRTEIEENTSLIVVVVVDGGLVAGVVLLPRKYKIETNSAPLPLKHRQEYSEFNR